MRVYQFRQFRTEDCPDLIIPYPDAIRQLLEGTFVVFLILSCASGCNWQAN